MERQSIFFIILSIIVALLLGDLFVIHQQMTSYKEALLSKAEEKNSDKKESNETNNSFNEIESISQKEREKVK
jgi:hypothetical protein